MDDRRQALLERLTAVPDELAGAARSASPEPPAPGEWTPSDIVRHLIAVELEVWHPRLAMLATQDNPSWPWAEPDRWTGDPGATLDDLLARYRAARMSTIATLDGLGEAGWARTGTHATYGVLDVAGLMGRAADHDDEHLRSFAS
jgi:DinB superfamily